MITVTVSDLTPGDIVHLGEDSATFVARTQHPLWPSLQLVIWRLSDGSWSHDALDARQEVGEADVVDAAVRQSRLRAALLRGDRR